MSSDPQELFNKGMRHLKKGELEEAARAFEKAYNLDRNDPAYMSYYGMCSALNWGKIEVGLELCTKAIKKEFFRAEYYLNLGKVYLAAGNKKGAITAFKKGLRFDPDNEEINELMIKLGIRKMPIIPFLRRSNPINKYLGILFRRILPNLFRRREPPRHG